MSPWQLTESEYIERGVNRQLRSAQRSAEHYAAELAGFTPRVGAKRRMSAQINYDWWSDMALVLAGGEPATERRYSGAEFRQKVSESLRKEYIEVVRKAISTGEDVPAAIVAQYPEFTVARDARARYDKGRHTSFANRSVAIDERTRPTRGFKTKRQDGKEISPDQIEEIGEVVSEVEEVLGSLREFLFATDLTIAHTSGKHPFLSTAGGLYSPMDRTVTVGVATLSGPVRAGAHEIAHWFDFESGTAMGRSTSILPTKTGRKRVEVAYVSEVDRLTADGDRAGRSLIEDAKRSINDVLEVRRLLRAKQREVGEEEKEVIERTKIHLGPYWTSPREIFARLFEQFVATRRGKQGTGHYAPGAYQRMAGWWTRDDFERLEARVEAEIKRRLEAFAMKYDRDQISAQMAPVHAETDLQAHAATSPPQVTSAPSSTETPAVKRGLGARAVEQLGLFDTPGPDQQRKPRR
jgi:hypothetical protein